MALFLPNSAFIHIPKTGGTSVRIMLRTGFFVKEVGKMHCIPAQLKPYMGDRFSFAFVRHPLWWWRSNWCWKVEHGWNNTMESDFVCKTYDFNEFISNVIERMPGYLSNLYRVYTEGLDFVGRTETLVDDLIKALSMAGETFNEKLIRETPMENCSQIKVEYDPKLAEKLLKVEKEVVEKYDFK